MFPLSNVLYPHAILPLHVFEPRYREMTATCLAGDGAFGVVLIARGSEVGGGEERTGLGTIAHIEEVATFDDGRLALVIRGLRRVEVTDWLPDDPFPRALVEERESAPLKDAESFEFAYRAVRRARALLSELGDIAALPPGLELGDDLEIAGWRLCAVAPVGALDSQRLLEIDDGAERMGLLARLMDEVAGDATLLLSTEAP